MDNRTSEIEGKHKWDVNAILDADSNKLGNGGYFGAYTKIIYQKKEAIVYCDDRDAIVHLKTGWYDHICYGKEDNSSWDGDYRWNHDKPLVAFNVTGPTFYLLAAHSGKELLSWSGVITPGWEHDRVIGDYLNGVTAAGEKVFITSSGAVNNAQVYSRESLENLLNIVKQYSTDEVLHCWIEACKPCYHIRGLEYKGAGAGKVSKDVALKLFQSHHDFKSSFNSAEWRILDGQVALLFRDYADSDYD